jgi:hypothetical protein
VRNPKQRIQREEVNVYEQDREDLAPQQERRERVEITRERYQEPYSRYVEAQLDVPDRTYTQETTYDREGRVVGGPAPAFEATLDTNERQFRQGTRPIVAEFAENRFGATARDFYQDKASRFGGPTQDFAPRQQADYTVEETSRSTVDPPRYPKEEIRVEKTTRTTVDPPKHKRDMGYYDDDGQYHSFRRGVQRLGERIAHPIHGPSLFRHDHDHHSRHDSSRVTEEEIVIKEKEVHAPSRHFSSSHSIAARPSRDSRPMAANTITIPCHHIRIGDLLILQGRPCQVIRITTSSQTGQHRYLGVDLFTKQLHEESSFISSPSPSVVVQNMLGPVFKQYRVLDIRDDGRVVAMTETGDVKQGLPVIDQSNLLDRLSDSFDNGRGSVRVLVISDHGQELAVDYKVVHGSRL